MNSPMPSDNDRLTRRGLLQAGAAAGVAAALTGPGTALASAVAGPPAYLRRSAYASLEGTTFTAAAVGGPVALSLESVADLMRAAREPSLAGSDDAFALQLTGPAATPLGAAAYTLTHAALGTFPLFLAPVGRAGETQAYEVVVDRTVRLAVANDRAPAPLERSLDAPVEAAVATAPASNMPGDSAPGAGGSAPEAKPAAEARVLRAAVARRGGVLSADVRFSSGRGIAQVRVALMRGDVVVAKGEARLRGRSAARIALRTRRPVAAGEYSLQVTTLSAAGRRSTVRRRAWLNA